MKKKIKLNLNKEVISELSSNHMGKMRGGTFKPFTNDVTCIKTCIISGCIDACISIQACPVSEENCTGDACLLPYTEPNNCMARTVDC